MMINIKFASTYNSRVANKVWLVSELPDPLKIAYGINGDAFSCTVAAYQSSLNLVVDGMLGPATWSAIRSMSSFVEDLSLRDFPGETDESNGVDNEPLKGVVQPDCGKKTEHGVSNVLVFNGKKIPLGSEVVAYGISAKNWLDDDGVETFDFRKRSEKLVHFVLHESVSTSVAATNRALNAKRKKTGYDFGIHFNVSSDGCIYQHNDPVLHRLVHANQINDSACGVEVVNPYNPKFGGSPWVNVIRGPWWCWKPSGADRVYTVPMDAQLMAVLALCRIVVRNSHVPWSFPTKDLNARKRRIDRWAHGAVVDPGIVAHRDFSSHADGRYLLEYVMRKSSIA